MLSYWPDNGILWKISYTAVLVAVVFVSRSVVLFFASLFLMLLNMFAHVMVAGVCLCRNILHDAKLWRAKTTTSPMGKSQYFISFWQAACFFRLFLTWWKHQRLDILVVVAMERHKRNISSIPYQWTYIEREQQIDLSNAHNGSRSLHYNHILACIRAYNSKSISSSNTSL